VAAGALDQRVKLLRREGGPSSTGSGVEVHEYVHAATVWARVQPARGSEGVAGPGRAAETASVFRVRFREDVDASWRIEWRGKQHDLVEILPAGHRLREWLDLTAVASPAENAG
jgi:SPP1 family predicted phage head-tail adaptor